MESLKLPTTPGVSPGVGYRKQGLLALQIMPCTQGSVPADGIALFGKWPKENKNKEFYTQPFKGLGDYKVTAC